MKKLLCMLALILFQISFAQKLPTYYQFADNLLTRGALPQTGFYDPERIDTIFLQFEQSDYLTQLTNNYDSKTNILATMTYQGQTYPDVGVRYKGQTSYRRVTGQKKSLNISIDHVDEDQSIDGYKTLNLNNGAEDPSFMREFLYYQMSRRHMPVASANFVVVNINGSNWGLYINVQQLNKQHASEWFTDDDCTRWRAEGENSSFGGGGGPPRGEVNEGPGGNRFGAGTSSLNDLGADTTTYQDHYTIKNSYKEDPWQDLTNACIALDNSSSDTYLEDLAKVFDIDGALWFIAHEILFTDDDSYVNKGGMDYYVYYDAGTNRILPMEYDGNSTLSADHASSWSPFYNADNSDFPVINKLLANPELRQRYLAHVRTLLDLHMNEETYSALVDKYSAMINGYVQDDPIKLFTYAQFQTESTVLKNFFRTRKNTYLANTEVNREAPRINYVGYQVEGNTVTNPPENKAVTIATSIVSSAGVDACYLYYGTEFAGSFTKVEMFDDGSLGDGSSGDNIYGAEIPGFPKNTYVRYYVEVVSADGHGTRAYSPVGAEHDVYMYQVELAERATSPIVINEIMPKNSTIVADDQGDFDDWVELYNTSNETVDLSGYPGGW